MKKRILSALLISALMLSMTACGESEKSTDSDDSSQVTTTTIAKEDDVTEATTTTSAVTEDDGKEETTTSTEEETKPDEEEPDTNERVLPDGPVNPTHRTEYRVNSSDYMKFIDGEYTLEELCALSESIDGKSEQTIEYTNDGYTVTTRYDFSEYGMSMDFVSTFNNRGELVHQKEATFDSQNPDGTVTFEGSFVQEHFKEGDVQGSHYSSEMSVSADNKIESMNQVQKELASNHKCNASSGWAVIHEDNRTIMYSPATCDLYNTETRENLTVMENGYFEAVLYNEDGKIEAIYSYNATLNDGKDMNGNSYATIQEFVDYSIENEWGICSAEWTYDKNGNVLSVKSNKDNVTAFYLYE